MTVHSRPTIPYQCHQAYHPWHPDCTTAASMLGKPCFRESFKIYCVLYGVTSLLKLKKIKSLEDLKRFVFSYCQDTIRSTFFLGFHGMFFMPALCSGRRLAGHISYYKLFLHILCVTYPAILIERKSRRGPLALYMANLAVEVLFKMAKQRQLVVPLNNGEIVLFAVASSIYTYMLKISSDQKENRFLFGIVQFLIGREECAGKNETTKKNIFDKFLERIFRSKIFENENRPTCQHRYHCIIHVILGFLKRFSVGVLIQLLLHFTSSPIRFLRNPLLFVRSLNENHLSLGKFFAFFCGIYRLIACLLRNVLKQDRPLNGLIAGYFAGFSMFFFKSSTLSMYMTAKLVEIVYFKSAKDGHLPIFKWFDGFLYAVSTALVFHAAIVEPQSIRPAYFRFLERLTGGHFSEVNRLLFDCLGTESSKLFPNYKLPSVGKNLLDLRA